MRSREWVEIHTIGTGMLVLGGGEAVILPTIWIAAVIAHFVITEHNLAVAG